jgi:hypothetical protein
MRRPRTRQCLLKGCENRFRPQQALERYCSDACREKAQAWSEWKAQQKYRGTPAGKEKRKGQSRRYRERVRNRKEQVCGVAEEAAMVIRLIFFDSSCDRPGWAGLESGKVTSFRPWDKRPASMVIAYSIARPPS